MTTRAACLGTGVLLAAALGSLGCASAPTPLPTAFARLDPFPAKSTPPMENVVPLVVPAAPTPSEPEYEPIPWPKVPAAVGCLVEKRADFYHLTVLDGSQTAIATVDNREVEAAWGIPHAVHGEAKPLVWVHAQSKGVAVTGLVAERELSLPVAQELEILRGHAWILAGARVTPLSVGRNGKVAVAPIQDLPGIERLRGYLTCAQLAAPPSEELLSTAPPPVLRPSYFAQGVSALREQPAGRVFAEIDAGGAVVELLETRKEWSRVAFRTASTRFDAWVESERVLSDEEGLGTIGTTGCACGHLPPAAPPWVLGRSIEPRLGTHEPAQAAGGVTLTAGTPVRVVHRVDGFWAVRAEDTGIHAPPTHDYWVPEDAVVLSSRRKAAASQTP